MTRYWKYLAAGFLALAIFVPAASARPGVFFRGYFGGPFYGPAYYGWYGPAYGGPYAEASAPYEGKVKFETKAKDAMVYVDGGYAGTVGKLKTFSLHAGTHNVELRDPSGHSYYQEQIDVVAGKTISLNP